MEMDFTPEEAIEIMDIERRDRYRTGIRAAGLPLRVASL
jgi:hypothetical protein